MGLIRLPISILVLVLLVAQATSQGYAGTVTTGKGIIPSLRVGSGGNATASFGSGNQPNFTGIWSFDLLDPNAKHMKLDLDIQQSKDALMGYGNMTSDGNSRRAEASGNISGSNIDLSVSIINSSEMYGLEVTRSGTYLTGKYDAYSSGAIILSGTVAGSISPSEALGKRATIILGNELSQAAPVDVTRSATTQESIWGASSNNTGHRIEKRSFSSTSNGGQVTTSDVSVITNYS